MKVATNIASSAVELDQQLFKPKGSSIFQNEGFLDGVSPEAPDQVHSIFSKPTEHILGVSEADEDDAILEDINHQVYQELKYSE
jgi:hypothetical protein